MLFPFGGLCCFSSLRGRKRCVIEVGRGNLEFHDPLIRVLETGYVSSYALATSYEALRWDLGEKGLSNVVDALQTEKLIPALEAYLKNVVDVAERDTVRSAMFAVSLNAKESKSVVASRYVSARSSLLFVFCGFLLTQQKESQISRSIELCICFLLLCCWKRW